MLLVLEGNVPVKSRWKEKYVFGSRYVNCTMECYWALCRIKGVCYVGRKSRCVYVSGTMGITERCFSQQFI